jgi:hypothetical protein
VEVDTPEPIDIQLASRFVVQNIRHPIIKGSILGIYDPCALKTWAVQLVGFFRSQAVAVD